MVENRKEPNFRGSKKKGQARKSNWINFIGLIILAVALITAAIIIVFYFSVEVKVENPTESSATTTVIETQTNNNSDTPGKVAPSEEVVPEPVPSEEPVENMPSEEDKEANNPSEEGETETPEEVYSNLKVKVQIDHIGKVWTRWTIINQAEGTTIGHDEIVNFVLIDMAKEFGNVAYQKSVGEKAEYTFSQADATYNTIIWIIG